MVWQLLSYIYTIFRTVRPVVWRGISRVFMFWRGGVFTYIGITSVVFIDNIEVFTQAFAADNPVEAPVIIVSGIGNAIATSWTSFVDGLMTLLASNGFITYNVFGLGVPVPEVLAAFWLVLIPIVTIGWYYRSVHLFLSFRYGEMIPYSASLFIGTVIFVLAMMAAGDFIPATDLTADLVFRAANVSQNVTG